MINNADYILDMGKRREKLLIYHFIEIFSKTLILKKFIKNSTFLKLGRNSGLDLGILEEAKQHFRILFKFYFQKQAEWDISRYRVIIQI